MEYSFKNKPKLSFKKPSLNLNDFSKYIKEVFQYGEIKTNPKISVIIVAYNEADDLIRCINSFENQKYQSYEIIVFDNGLDENTKKKLEDLNLTHIISKENVGPAIGRNVLALYAKGDLLVSIDADGYVEKDYLEQVDSLMEDKNIIAARGLVKQFGKNTEHYFEPEHYNLGSKQIPYFINIEGNTVIRKNDYIKVGGMENDLYGHEGIILSYRMHAFYDYGKEQFVYAPNLILYHNFHSDNIHLKSKFKRYELLNYFILNKYPLIENYLNYYEEVKSSLIKQDIGGTGNDKAGENIKIKARKEFEKELNRKIDSIQKARANKASKKKVLDFSVIIPCYNLGKLLPTAIESAMRQTLENIEIIVVDDASPDKETQEVLSEMEKMVKVIRLKENKGVSVARNAGIEVARGKYILCLDADDTIEPTYLEKAFNIFESDEKVGIVSCWLKSFGATDAVWTAKDNIEIRDALINPPVHTASCFRKADWEEGGIYDPKLRGFEDWDHWLRIMKIRPLVRVIPEFLFNYYVRLGSKVETSNKNSFKLTSHIIENHKDLYQEHFLYVIARKQEVFALNANKERFRELELRSNMELLRQKNEEIGLMQESKFWKLREFYLTMKHWLVFVFLNPRKFIKSLLISLKNYLQKITVRRKAEKAEAEKKEDKADDFKSDMRAIKKFSKRNNKPCVKIKKRKLSVVMLSLNRLKDTKETVRALYENINFDFEFIILDNGSDSDVVEYLKKLTKQKNNIKLILEKENLGCAGGRNKAFSLATGDYILSVDNDIIITKYAVENLIETLESSKEVVGACCKTVFPDGSIHFNGGKFVMDKKFVEFSLIDRGKKYDDESTFKQLACDWIPGGATMWKSFIIKKMTIDPKMKGSFEDNEYSIMLQKKGFALSNCPKSIAIHNHINFNKEAKEDRRYIESRYNQERIKAALVRLYQKHDLIIRDRYLGELGLDIDDDKALIEYFEKYK